MRFVASLPLVLSAFTVVAPAQDREPTKNELLFAIEKQLQAANETAGPCVACVVVSRSEKYPKPASASDVPGTLGAFDPVQFRKDQPQASAALAKSLDLSRTDSIPDHGFACGVIIDSKGLILTPFHVVEGATKIYVHLPGQTGSYADIHAGDARHDLAVLRLITPPRELKAIKFADVRLDNRDGQRANATAGKLTVLVASSYIPNFLINKPSAALGSVTNVRRHLVAAESREKLQRRLDNYHHHGPYLEHDAKLNTGISGAALLDLNGEMIGLTTTAPVPSLGEKSPELALPMTAPLLSVIDVLRRGEEVEGGALCIKLSSDDKSGVKVADVFPLGPAAKAGLITGDRITGVNGIPIKSYDDLLSHIGSILAGAKVILTVCDTTNDVRDVALTLGKWSHKQPTIASVRPDPVFGLRVDHDSILAQTFESDARVLPAIASKGIPTGVSIGTLAPNSPAETAFKKLGDEPQKRWLITHINGKAVSSPGEFYAAAKGKKAIKLTVIDPTEAKRPEREVSFP